MSDTDPIIGQVTIYYYAPDDVRIDPPLGLINRVHQNITWTLRNESMDQSVKFPPVGGIYFPWPIEPPPPPPDEPVYSRWPSAQPTGNATVYTADAMSPVAGEMSEFYLYYIALETSTGPIIIKQPKHPITLELIDPPVENEPKP